MRGLLSGLVVLLVASWGGAEDKKEAKKLDLYPLVKGTKWEYEVTVNDKVVEVLQEVTKVTPGGKGERPVVTISAKTNDNTILEEASSDDKGAYRHSVSGKK